MAAARARSIAEWNRKHHINTFASGLREIDREGSQVNPGMTDEEKGIVRTAMMGGAMAKQEIDKFNEDYDATCDYCKEVCRLVILVTFLLSPLGETKQIPNRFRSTKPVWAEAGFF